MGRLGDVLGHLRGVLGRLGGPLEPSKALQDRPRTPQELPGSPQDSPRTPQDPPGSPREAPKTPPGRPPDPPRMPPGRPRSAGPRLMSCYLRLKETFSGGFQPASQKCHIFWNTPFQTKSFPEMSQHSCDRHSAHTPPDEDFLAPKIRHRPINKVDFANWTHMKKRGPRPRAPGLQTRIFHTPDM